MSYFIFYKEIVNKCNYKHWTAAYFSKNCKLEVHNSAFTNSFFLFVAQVKKSQKKNLK